MRLLLFLTLALIACSACNLFGQTTHLDPTFGVGGKVKIRIKHDAMLYGMTLDSSNRIVAVGSTKSGDLYGNIYYQGTVARFTTEGTLDTSFNSSGILIDIRVAAVYDAAIQPDGKILVLGDKSGNFRLLRFHANGKIDSSFGIAGQVTTDFIDLAKPHAMEVQEDGKILAVGSITQKDAGEDNFVIARYDVNGLLDESFGFSGIRIIDFANSYDRANDLLITSDSTIVVGGLAGSRLSSDFGMAAFDFNGALSSSFGVRGVAIIDVPSRRNNWIEKMALQPDGKIVITGGEASSKSFVVARFNANGVLDSGFGVNGVTQKVLGFSVGLSSGVAITAEGQIVVTGTSDSVFTCVQFDSNGTVDTGFGTNGVAFIDFGGSGDQAYSMLLQPDGKILIGGFSNDGKVKDFALTRLLPVAIPASVNEETPSEFKTNVYPNPVRSVLNLSPIAPDVQPTISDVLGRSIAIPYTQSDNNLALDVSTLERGIYWIRYGSQLSKFFKL